MEDCYYYFYSSCSKGAQCPFRHCEGARLNEVTCENWEKTHTCTDPSCIKRHSIYHLQKNRSSIPCYWEKNGGCKKGSLCPYKHDSALSSQVETPVEKASYPKFPVPKNDPKAEVKNVKVERIKPVVAAVVEKTIDLSNSKKRTNEEEAGFKVKSFEEIMREKRLKKEQGGSIEKIKTEVKQEIKTEVKQERKTEVKQERKTEVKEINQFKQEINQFKQEINQVKQGVKKEIQKEVQRDLFTKKNEIKIKTSPKKESEKNTLVSPTEIDSFLLENSIDVNIDDVDVEKLDKELAEMEELLM
jgi:hypothetical protein